MITQAIYTNLEILQHFGGKKLWKEWGCLCVNCNTVSTSNVICICRLEMSDVMRREVAEHKQEGPESKQLPTELLTFPAMPLFQPETLSPFLWFEIPSGICWGTTGNGSDHQVLFLVGFPTPAKGAEWVFLRADSPALALWRWCRLSCAFYSQKGLCPRRSCPVVVAPIIVWPVTWSDISITNFFSYEEQYFAITTKVAKNASAKNSNGQLWLCVYKTQILVDYKIQFVFSWDLGLDLWVSVLLIRDIQHGLSVL